MIIKYYHILQSLHSCREDVKIPADTCMHAQDKDMQETVCPANLHQTQLCQTRSIIIVLHEGV